jgi:hypothetical protein
VVLGNGRGRIGEDADDTCQRVVVIARSVLAKVLFERFTDDLRLGATPRPRGDLESPVEVGREIELLSNGNHMMYIHRASACATVYFPSPYSSSRALS